MQHTHKQIAYFVLLLLVNSVPAEAQNCTTGLTPIMNNTLANATPVWGNFWYLGGCAAPIVNPTFTGPASGTSPVLTVVGSNSTATGQTVEFDSNLGSANSFGNQVNITNTAGWGLLAGFDGPGVTAANYHGPNTGYLISVVGPLNLGASNGVDMTISSGGTVGIGTTSPLAALHVVGPGSNGAIYATSSGSNNTAYGVLPSNGLIDISAGVSLQSGSWIAQNSATTAGDVMVMHPGTGVQWYAETGTANGSAVTSWNIANNVTLWSDSGYWSNLVQSTASGTSYFTGGNVGIGTTTPAYALDVAGTINTNQASGFSQAGNTVLYSNPANFTLAVGASSAASWMNSLTSTSWYSVAIGSGALNTSPSTSAIENVAVGYNSLEDDTSGSKNTAVGYEALQAETTGLSNTAVGNDALNNASSGNSNVAVGSAAAFRNTGPIDATMVGAGAGSGAASYANTGGTYIGFRAGYDSGNSSNYNVFVGFEAGYDITSGARNIILAEEDSTNDGITTGSNNILIGSNLSAPSATGSNQLDIGNIIFGTGLTGTGTTIAGSIGIGLTTPSYMLQVNGPVAGNGAYVNTSDSRLKKNIVPIKDALATVEQLQGVRFNWRKPAERTVGKNLNLPTDAPQVGFVAQDLGKVLPEAVSTAGSPDKIMSVAESKVVPVLVEAVKELKAKNDAQAFQVASLQARLGQLQNASNALADNDRRLSALVVENTALKTRLLDIDQRLMALERRNRVHTASRGVSVQAVSAGHGQ